MPGSPSHTVPLPLPRYMRAAALGLLLARKVSYVGCGAGDAAVVEAATTEATRSDSGRPMPLDGKMEGG